MDFEWLQWIYGRWFAGHPWRGYIVITGVSWVIWAVVLGFMWLRALDAYGKEHSSIPAVSNGASSNGVSVPPVPQPPPSKPRPNPPTTAVTPPEPVSPRPRPAPRKQDSAELSAAARQFLESMTPKFISDGNDLLRALIETDDVRIVNSLNQEFRAWEGRAKIAIGAYLNPAEAAKFENLPVGKMELSTISSQRLATMDDDHKANIGKLETRLAYLRTLVDDVRTGKR
jgi:hypothetical protein